MKLMQSYCKAYRICKGSSCMGHQLVMWIDIILRKPKVHLRYKSMVSKVAIQGGTPQRRPNMEPRDIQSNNSLVRKLTTPRNCVVVRLVHIPRGEGRRGNIPRAMTLNILRNPSHPFLMGILKRGKKKKFCYSA